MSSAIFSANITLDDNTNRVVSNGGHEEFKNDLIRFLSDVTRSPVHIQSFTHTNNVIEVTCIIQDKSKMKEIFDIHAEAFDLSKYKSHLRGLALGIVDFMPTLAI